MQVCSIAHTYGENGTKTPLACQHRTPMQPPIWVTSSTPAHGWGYVKPVREGGLLRPSPDGRPGPDLPAPTCWHGLRNIRAADQDAGFATVRRDHRLIVELNPTIEGRFLSEPTGETPTGCRFAISRWTPPQSVRPELVEGTTERIGTHRGQGLLVCSEVETRGVERGRGRSARYSRSGTSQRPERRWGGCTCKVAGHSESVIPR